jgi:hypothetical protein
MDGLGEDPVEADLTGVVRQIEQLAAPLQLRTEVYITLFVQLHFQRGFQHFLQLLEADLIRRAAKSM